MSFNESEVKQFEALAIFFMVLIIALISLALYGYMPISIIWAVSVAGLLLIVFSIPSEGE